MSGNALLGCGTSTDLEAIPAFLSRVSLLTSSLLWPEDLEGILAIDGVDFNSLNSSQVVNIATVDIDSIINA